MLDYLRGLRAAAAGEMDAHVWESDQFPGAPMQYVFMQPGETVDVNAHQLPADFAAKVSLRYLGIVPPQEAAARVATIERARSLADR